MIILDTNIVSEIYKDHPDPNAAAWFQALPPNSIQLTAISFAELEYGVSLLPQGKRRAYVLERVTVIYQDFAEFVLPFDDRCAVAYGQLYARLKLEGQNVGQNDVMIAAIARVHGATVATRNTRDFAHCGIALQNPFEGPRT